MKARVFASAVLLLGSVAARAQLTCAPAHLTAGSELRIDDPGGAFGASPSPDIVFAYRPAAGGASVAFSAPRSWTATEVRFLLPAGLASGAYAVTMTSPRLTLGNPSCFTVDPPLHAVTSIRGSVAGSIPSATLDIVVDGDWPCDGQTKITLWGKGFTPGTEGAGINPVRDWSSGKTMVEIGAEGRPSAGMPPSTAAGGRLVVRDPGTIEFTVSKCLLMLPGLKVRVWLPDGTKTVWQQVRTAWDHPGSGVDGVLITR